MLYCCRQEELSMFEDEINAVLSATKHYFDIETYVETGGCSYVIVFFKEGDRYGFSIENGWRSTIVTWATSNSQNFVDGWEHALREAFNEIDFSEE